MPSLFEIYRGVVDAYGALGWPVRVGIIAVLAVGTTVGGMAVVVALPVDHFTRAPSPDSWWRRHRIVRWAGIGVKNLLGILILPLGIAMALPFVPGPGLVFILLGLSLLDFPGKKKLERRFLSIPSVLRFLNDMRSKYGKPPLIVDPE